MIKIKMNEQEYFLPSNWDEVTFEQLLKLKKVNFETVKGNILSTSLAISALTGIDNKAIMKLPANDFAKLAEKTKWLHDFKVNAVFRNEFEFDGVKYKLTQDFKTLTAGEVASIEQYALENVEANLDKILAILIREVDEAGNLVEFDSNTVESRAEIFKKKMTIGEVNAISNFFLDGKEVSMQITVDSSEQSSGIQMEEI